MLSYTKNYPLRSSDLKFECRNYDHFAFTQYTKQTYQQALSTHRDNAV